MSRNLVSVVMKHSIKSNIDSIIKTPLSNISTTTTTTAAANTGLVDLVFRDVSLGFIID